MSGSISSLRRSDSSRASRSPISRGRSCASAVREKCRPITAARSRTVRSSGRSRSMRAASSAWMVGGISRSASSTPAVQRSPSRLSAPSWTSMRTSSPTKSGLPSLVASTRPAIAAGSASAPITFAASRVAAPASSPASVTTSLTQAAGRRQRRARVAQLGPRGRQHQQRHVAAPLHQVLDQVEQQRLRPLDVVDRQHHRPHAGERGEPAADDEEDLLRRSRRAGQQRRDPVGDPGALGLAFRQPRQDRRAQVVAAAAVVDAEQPAQRLGERREGGAAGRVAMRHQDGRPVAEAAGELVDQTRLAETRRSEHHGQAGSGRRDGGVVDRADAPQLVVAPDERDRRRAGRPLERHHAVRRHRLGPALQREAAEGRQRHAARRRGAASTRRAARRRRAPPAGAAPPR